MKHKVIHESLADLARQWHALNNGMKSANGKSEPHPNFWGDMLTCVNAWDRALRKLRTAVRTQERKQRRAYCAHLESKRRVYSDGSAVCGGCGLKFKAPDRAAL